AGAGGRPWSALRSAAGTEPGRLLPGRRGRTPRDYGPSGQIRASARRRGPSPPCALFGPWPSPPRGGRTGARTKPSAPLHRDPAHEQEGDTGMAPVVTMRQLLESGVHFGHQTRRWNPKMKRFILAERNGIYIIDLQQSLDFIDKAYEFIRKTVTHD